MNQMTYNTFIYLNQRTKEVCNKNLVLILLTLLITTNGIITISTAIFYRCQCTRYTPTGIPLISHGMLHYACVLNSRVPDIGGLAQSLKRLSILKLERYSISYLCCLLSWGFPNTNLTLFYRIKNKYRRTGI